MRPGLGVGGYCLTKDPDFINFSGKYIFKKKFSFPITNISMKINKRPKMKRIYKLYKLYKLYKNYIKV